MSKFINVTHYKGSGGCLPSLFLMMLVKAAVGTIAGMILGPLLAFWLVWHFDGDFFPIRLFLSVIAAGIGILPGALIGMVVQLILGVIFGSIVENSEIKTQDGEIDIKKLAKKLGVKPSDDLPAIAFTHWPENAKNPVTGRRYGPRERTTENAVKWFLGPQETTDEI